MRSFARLRPNGGPLAGYAAALVAVGLATVLLVLLAPLELTSGSMVYLLAVLLVAIGFGRGPAVASSVLAFLAFDFFLTEPRFTLTVRDPDEWVALLTFLVVAIVTSQLAAAVRDRARSAEAREREARLLHDLADLLSLQPLSTALGAVCERLGAELGNPTLAIVVSDEQHGRVATGDDEVIRALRAPSAPAQVLAPGSPATGAEPGRAGRWVRISPPHGARTTAAGSALVRVPIRHRDRTLGQIAMHRDDRAPLSAADARLLDTAADQIAFAFDRDRLRVEALEAEVLRRTDELKTALLDAVSHDLRTPLAGIIASAGSIRQTDVEWSDVERVEFAETIEREAERLNRIVGNLLDLGRIQGGTLRPARAWHDPGLALRDSVERLRSAATDHRLEVDIPDPLDPAFFDPVEIDQVVANLVENAIKYTPPGGAIRVAARQDDGTLTVAVEDGGPGIPAASLPRLFEPFYRAPGAERVRGSGLGLAVARGLVEAHGGRISAENLRGGGARFVFTLPSPARPEEPDE